jgi:hypothetical protein
MKGHSRRQFLSTTTAGAVTAFFGGYAKSAGSSPNDQIAVTAHRTAALIHLGEIAYRTRTVLEFDPKTETINNSKEAHAMLTKEYREPYGLPSRL